jgi:hypothetical protein
MAKPTDLVQGTLDLLILKTLAPSAAHLRLWHWSPSPPACCLLGAQRERIPCAPCGQNDLSIN